MAVDLSRILVVGISSSALFDTSKAHKIFLASGVEAYVLFQIENENKPLAPGNAWLYAVSCGTQRSHFVMAGANGWAGRWLSLDMRK